MNERKFDELISYFNRKVSDMDIDRHYKMELLGMVTALGYAHEKESEERKTGRWLEKEVFHEVESSSPIEQWQSAKCSVCGKYHTTPYLYYFDDYAFCPNCGSPMKGGDADD